MMKASSFLKDIKSEVRGMIRAAAICVSSSHHMSVIKLNQRLSCTCGGGGQTYGKKRSRVTYFKCEVDVSFSLRTAASAYEKRLDVSAILTIAFQEKRMNKSTGREKSLRTHKRRDNEISKNITILLGQGTHTAETC